MTLLQTLAGGSSLTGRNAMYIGLGTILLILLIVLLFRAMSGRRV